MNNAVVYGWLQVEKQPIFLWKLTTPAENPRQVSQHIAVAQSRFAPSFRRLLPLRTIQLNNIQLKVKIWDRYTKNEERTLAKR